MFLQIHKDIFFLMKMSLNTSSPLSLKAAFQFVKSKRRVVLPNVGFLAQLIESELKLFGSTSLRLGPHGQLFWI